MCKEFLGSINYEKHSFPFSSKNRNAIKGIVIVRVPTYRTKFTINIDIKTLTVLNAVIPGHRTKGTGYLLDSNQQLVVYYENRQIQLP